MLVNPAGVVFGPGSQLNVGGITASTLAISDADFLDGDDYHFRGNATASKVLNRGKLNANGGIVALIAPVVENEGVIDAPRGAAVLAGRRVGHPGLHGRRAAFRHRGKIHPGRPGREQGPHPGRRGPGHPRRQRRP